MYSPVGAAYTVKLKFSIALEYLKYVRRNGRQKIWIWLLFVSFDNDSPGSRTLRFVWPLLMIWGCPRGIARRWRWNSGGGGTTSPTIGALRVKAFDPWGRNSTTTKFPKCKRAKPRFNITRSCRCTLIRRKINLYQSKGRFCPCTPQFKVAICH